LLNDQNGSLGGPFNIWLRNPAIGLANFQFGAALRESSMFSTKVREMVILLTATPGSFEWTEHEHLGKRAGLTDDEIKAIRLRNTPKTADAREQLIIETIRQLNESGDLTDELFEAAEEQLGIDGLVELTTLVGRYWMISLQNRVFRTGVANSYA
jgi:4-carboxymuconolactone decarboxylase